MPVITAFTVACLVVAVSIHVAKGAVRTLHTLVVVGQSHVQPVSSFPSKDECLAAKQEIINDILPEDRDRITLYCLPAKGKL